METDGIKSIVIEKAPAVLGEMMAVGLIVCLGCMSCVTGFSTGPPPAFQQAFGFGMVVMFLVHIFAPVSGAHFNPAITVSALLFRKITPLLACAYVAAQVAGGWLGFGLLRLLTPTAIMYPDGFNVTGVCSTVPHPDITVIQAFFVEFIATAILVLLSCACWDPVNSDGGSTVALKFGFTIAAISVFAGPYTGASMNPARTLGPAIWNNDWDGHWIYWVSPLLSGVVCTVMYRAIFLKTPTKTSRQNALEEFPLSNQEKTAV